MQACLSLPGLPLCAAILVSWNMKGRLIPEASPRMAVLCNESISGIW